MGCDKTIAPKKEARRFFIRCVNAPQADSQRDGHDPLK
jgi:hypothetical protein